MNQTLKHLDHIIEWATELKEHVSFLDVDAERTIEMMDEDLDEILSNLQGEEE